MIMPNLWMLPFYIDQGKRKLYVPVWQPPTFSNLENNTKQSNLLYEPQPNITNLHNK